MDLNNLKRMIEDFDKKTGFDKTEFSKLIEMFEEEIGILKSNPHDKTVVDHELTDLLILIMQIAHRYDTDFEKELDEWFKKSRKYVKRERNKETYKSSAQSSK